MMIFAFDIGSLQYYIVRDNAILSKVIMCENEINLFLIIE